MGGRERERERGLLIASATPKKTCEEGGINRREGELRRETPNPRCTQFGNTARCHGNAALPQSQSPHAERQRQRWERGRQQQEHIPSPKSSDEGGERLGEVRGRKSI